MKIKSKRNVKRGMTGRPGSSGDEGPIGRSGPDAEYVML